MSNEFDDKENDQAWVALTANDPAQHLTSPELDALKASVLSKAIKVSPISKRSWLAPVAVAASVALFVGGGAGYTIAAQSGSDVPNVISAPATEMGGAAGAEDSKMAYWGGRAFLEADSGILDTSGSAIGYTFDASDIDRKAQLKKIADIFSVSGEITGSSKDGYFVGDQNYVKAVAQLSGASWDLDQLITWNYSDSSVSPTYCGGNIPMYDTKSSGDAPASVTATDVATPEPMPTVVPEPMPAPSDCTKPSGVLPSDESALAFAKEKFGALDFNSESAVWSVVDGGGMWGYTSELAGAYKLVTAKVLINGIDTNQSWSMTIGPDDSILNASGFFASFIPTAEYTIVGAKTAIERSQNGLWANLAPQEIYKDGMVYPMELGTSANSSAVAKNSAGQPILDANIDRVKITKAEPSLISWYLNDGSTILLPAYLLSESSANESRQWLQLAIADEYVDFS
ncbi:unannotated protein [freshwater metagenome]|uniref:Unannotated protein n=1 Tax=freshwater metagenome TaxID=449393 RepID=A0A6J6JZL1_9ZZZZ|nr:hypothetical protein [Actinomycetota bacterium]MSZ33074.1 hypothetical protein [Actinomycetota bacterium]